MRATIRTNRWHAVKLWTRDACDGGGVRLTSDPSNPGVSAYLSLKSAINLHAALGRAIDELKRKEAK